MALCDIAPFPTTFHQMWWICTHYKVWKPGLNAFQHNKWSLWMILKTESLINRYLINRSLDFWSRIKWALLLLHLSQLCWLHNMKNIFQSYSELTAALVQLTFLSALMALSSAIFSFCRWLLSLKGRVSTVECWGLYPELLVSGCFFSQFIKLLP